MIRTKNQELEVKRQQVRHAYVENGVHSHKYREQFNQLHDLNMVFMATTYRSIHGLPSWAVTPYS